MTRRAIVSVSDKQGVVDFVRGLTERKFEILSTGGTAEALKAAGLPVTLIEDFTGFPEIMNGRVKTLHPFVYAGVLFRRGHAGDERELLEHARGAVDLVAVNLYPFLETIKKPGCVFADAIEQIDIGGPTLLRAAAKNHEHVWPVCDRRDYPRVLESLDMQLNAQGDERPLRRELAQKVFAHTSAYDGAVADYLASEPGQTSDSAPDGAHDRARENIQELLPENLTLNATSVLPLRYGENPHQIGRYYLDQGQELSFKQWQGKALSYNNLLDCDAAWDLVQELPQPSCVVVKHNIPCGVATGKDAVEAFSRALECDSLSAFGGIVALNVPLTENAAQKMAAIFLEVVMAPEIDPSSIEPFKKKKNLRILQVDPSLKPAINMRRAFGGILAQTADVFEDVKTWKCVTEKQPTAQQLKELEFAMRVCRGTRSNAIVVVSEGQAIGVGGGHVNRIDAAKMAVERAQGRGGELVAASDAFFPFRDGLDALAQGGVKAVVQPGGSKRDQEVIAAANEQKIVMVFSGARHFRH